MSEAHDIDWDDPRTALAYERFYQRHTRYARANEALVAHAALADCRRVLDVGAGTARTTRAMLPHLGPAARVVCVEPARAMRKFGTRRIQDARVSWTGALPTTGERFDRIVSGAAIWQLLPLEATFRRLAALLAPGGALVFNIPALYLLENTPTSRSAASEAYDPFQELVAQVDRSGVNMSAMHAEPMSALPRGAAAMDALLRRVGLAPERWTFSVRVTTTTWRDWFKIPPVANGLLAGIPLGEREVRLNHAYQHTAQWVWSEEPWFGWTAWRR